MGNCAASRHAGESWTDDGEWDEEASSSTSEDGDHHHASEVTIRITKRQLQELMERKTPGGRGSTRQLLADIMESGEVHHHDLHREEHWKPALQSIPEAAES
ncbi:hypothetical protein D1007_44952 [Hordeum vulgare]|uniref:Uncharacterized protein n=1 Tax=Hordeum vulgare subsp. vulgare TaxID=112509 RepID=A0A8I7BAH4_HORVV|nr:uncharacterized protein LOC123440360 [Hordeum vulgare subsp. vulgare]KAE8781752.1 hypothetical protein D1007_44952 [Hordeum vulgare]KAI5007437.1 hypothetical protein ZWY2020_050882 [Hordeum vulgare]